MKKLIYTFLFFFTVTALFANEVIISFQSKVSGVVIDSIHATNLTKGQTVKLSSGESLLIAQATSSDLISFDNPLEGYLYPNPTDGYTTLSFNTTQIENVFISIYDMAGKMLRSKTQSLTQGVHKFHLRFPTPGLYHVNVLTNGGQLNYKAVYIGRTQQVSEIEYLGSNQLTAVNARLKSAHTEKSLDYSEGNVIHYVVFSGDNTTLISDTPKESKTIKVEFFECKDPDNRNYKIVQIGDQWWMAENMAYLPVVYQPHFGRNTEPRYYVYNYNGSDVATAKQQPNYTTYGVLYNWPAAKAACPPGWHLPSDDEWKQLEMALGMTQPEANVIGYRGTYQGEQMKATSGWYNNRNGTNTSGFSALPGGFRYFLEFHNIGRLGYWWSSTESISSDAWLRYLSSDYSGMYRYDYSVEWGVSVRCVKDLPPTAEFSHSPISPNINETIQFSDLSTNYPVSWLWDFGDGTTSTQQNPLKIYNEAGQFTVSLKVTNSVGNNTKTISITVASEIIHGSFTDSRDGKTYKTLKIGDQVWMAENLAYLPAVNNRTTPRSSTAPQYYVYDYTDSDVATAKQQPNYTTYGVLYNWPAAKAACPPGWHLPTDAEWTALENYLIANGFNYDGTTTGNKIAKSLAATTNWYPTSNTGAIGNDLSLNNKSRFSALPGGDRNPNGGFYNSGGTGFWWSSTEISSNSAWYRTLDYNVSTIGRHDFGGKEFGFSVRCVRDN